MRRNFEDRIDRLERELKNKRDGLMHGDGQYQRDEEDFNGFTNVESQALANQSLYSHQPP